LVDGNTALIGGINIAQKYEGSKLETPWLDFAVKVSGPICSDVLHICESVFKKKERQKFKQLYHHHIKIKAEKQNVSMRLLQNDWVRKNIEISTFYRHSIKHSTQSLVIVASYFLPGNRMRFLLRKAAERGVKITLLLSGKSDVGLMKHAANYLYPFLLRNNIEVYEWKTSVLHGKIMLVDDKLTTVGSYNINALSDYGSLELNVLVDDIKFNMETQNNITQLLKEDCQKINKSDYKKQQHFYQQMINWFSYQLTRTSLKLLFFFMRK
jgi:cardiolipin synthase